MAARNTHSSPLRAAGFVAVCLLATALCFPPQAAASPPRSAGLQKAWSNPDAMRSVLFVRGMTCRACTMLLDRRLATTPGIYWARFNFPLRLFVVYHDPRTASLGSIRKVIDSTGELRTETLASEPAAAFTPAAEAGIASWKGGGVGSREAGEIPRRFLATLAANGLERGENEFDQVLYEILGEEVRNRVLAARAADAGYERGPAGTHLPTVIAREFYYPASALEPGPVEAGVARFLLDRVLLGDEGDAGRERFDTWLLELWRKRGLDFRGELIEKGLSSR